MQWLVRIACMCNTHVQKHSTNEVGEKWAIHNVMHRWLIIMGETLHWSEWDDAKCYLLACFIVQSKHPTINSSMPNNFHIYNCICFQLGCYWHNICTYILAVLCGRCSILDHLYSLTFGAGIMRMLSCVGSIILPIITYNCIFAVFSVVLQTLQTVPSILEDLQ